MIRWSALLNWCEKKQKEVRSLREQHSCSGGGGGEEGERRVRPWVGTPRLESWETAEMPGEQTQCLEGEQNGGWQRGKQGQELVGPYNLREDLEFDSEGEEKLLEGLGRRGYGLTCFQRIIMTAMWRRDNIGTRVGVGAQWESYWSWEDGIAGMRRSGRIPGVCWKRGQQDLLMGGMWGVRRGESNTTLAGETRELAEWTPRSSPAPAPGVWPCTTSSPLWVFFVSKVRWLHWRSLRFLWSLTFPLHGWHEVRW